MPPNEHVPKNGISRWEGLEGKALYSAMAAEWQELVSQLEQPLDDK